MILPMEYGVVWGFLELGVFERLGGWEECSYEFTNLYSVRSRLSGLCGIVHLFNSLLVDGLVVPHVEFGCCFFALVLCLCSDILVALSIKV